MVSGDFMSVLQDLIPESISGQKYRTNVGPFLNSYRNMGIWIVVWMSKHGHVHRKSNVQVALQLADSTVICVITPLNVWQGTFMLWIFAKWTAIPH